MSATIVPGCKAEIHFPEEGVGRSCSLAEHHTGAHWGMKPIEGNGYTPISWWGSDADVHPDH